MALWQALFHIKRVYLNDSLVDLGLMIKKLALY